MPNPGTLSSVPVSVEELFSAFSDRTRLRILNLLKTGETCVCDLMKVLGVPQAKVSRHLSRLRKAGLVKARKQGLWHYYRLIEPETRLHRKLLECLECCLSDIPELDRDLLLLNRLRMQNSCCPRE